MDELETVVDSTLAEVEELAERILLKIWPVSEEHPCCPDQLCEAAQDNIVQLILPIRPNPRFIALEDQSSIASAFASSTLEQKVVLQGIFGFGLTRDQLLAFHK